MHQGNAQRTAINSILITLHIRTARLHIFFNSARSLSEQPALGNSYNVSKLNKNNISGNETFCSLLSGVLKKMCKPTPNSESESFPNKWIFKLKPSTQLIFDEFFFLFLFEENSF